MATSASCTSNRTRSYEDFIDRSRFPKMPFQRVAKEAGSKELVWGKWVTVPDAPTMQPGEQI